MNHCTMNEVSCDNEVQEHMERSTIPNKILFYNSSIIWYTM